MVLSLAGRLALALVGAALDRLPLPVLLLSPIFISMFRPPPKGHHQGSSNSKFLSISGRPDMDIDRLCIFSAFWQQFCKTLQNRFLKIKKPF